MWISDKSSVKSKLKEEIKEGVATKIHDDLIIGGESQKDTIPQYTKILEKLHLANLKVEPEKTTIFPESCDIAGWI